MSVIVEGVGLHSGAKVRVKLARRPGPCAFWFEGEAYPTSRLHVLSTLRATTLGLPERGRGQRVGTVEHFCSALGAMSVYQGLSVEVDGPEMPLLDGGAVEWCDALDKLALTSQAPPLTITVKGTVRVGESVYTFVPEGLAPESSSVSRNVSVEVEYEDTRLFPAAQWRGDLNDYRARIAPARTYAFESELASLSARGLANNVDPASVIVIGDNEIYASETEFSPDEPARHKLLDLIGDLYIYGGPPVGEVHAFRPGHAATHRAIHVALERNLLSVPTRAMTSPPHRMTPDPTRPGKTE